MVGESLQNVLATLKSERDRIDSAIAAIEGLVAGKVAAKRGRPAKKVTKAATRGRRKRKNAPRGLLKQKIHEVLKGTRKPIAPVDLRDAVLKAGYPSKNPKTLYTAIFTAARSDPAIKKTKEGFSLK